MTFGESHSSNRGNRADFDQIVRGRHLGDLHHGRGRRWFLEILAPNFVDPVKMLHVADIDIDAADVVERAARGLDGALEIFTDLAGLRLDIADACD
jgi:hypothetical protein